MSYSGFLIKVGDYEITGQRYVDFASYDATVEIQDLDSYRDANGVLHRNALSHVPVKVNFQTLPNLNNDEIGAFFSAISDNYTNALERKAIVTAFIPELNSYVTQDMYMAGPTLKIRKIDPQTNQVYYDSCKITFIGY